MTSSPNRDAVPAPLRELEGGEKWFVDQVIDGGGGGDRAGCLDEVELARVNRDIDRQLAHRAVGPCLFARALLPEVAANDLIRRRRKRQVFGERVGGVG